MTAEIAAGEHFKEREGQCMGPEVFEEQQGSGSG